MPEESGPTNLQDSNEPNLYTKQIGGLGLSSEILNCAIVKSQVHEKVQSRGQGP